MSAPVPAVVDHRRFCPPLTRRSRSGGARAGTVGTMDLDTRAPRLLGTLGSPPVPAVGAPASPPRPGPAAPRAPRVLVVSGSVGAGHDGAARELAQRLRSRGVEVQVRDFMDAIRPAAQRLLREGYTSTVGYVPFAFEFLFRRLEHPGLLWRAERAICASGTPTVHAWVREVGPDVVVSTYPLATQCLGDLRAAGELGAPLVTYLTDPAVHASWLHPATDVHLTVTEAAAAQGRAQYGVETVAAGPLVPARFAVPLGLERLVALRGELGLPTGRPVALLVAGSLGLGDVVPTVRDVAAAGLAPVVLCGRNERLRRRVDAMEAATGLGWRDDVHELVQVADVMVQNAGGLSATEAMVAGLPMVTYRSIPGHGRANARVMHEAGLAPWAQDAPALARALHEQVARGRTVAQHPDPADAVLDVACRAGAPAVPAAAPPGLLAAAPPSLLAAAPSAALSAAPAARAAVGGPVVAASPR